MEFREKMRCGNGSRLEKGCDPRYNERKQEKTGTCRYARRVPMGGKAEKQMKLPETDRKPRRRLWLLLLLCYPAAAILLLLAECVPGFAEQYARGPYAVYSRAGNFFSALFPFSLAEILLILATAFAVFWIVKQVVRIVRAKGARLREAGGSLLRLLCAAGVVLLLFQLNCGINYSRDSFAETCGLPVQESSREELETLCSSLVEKLNTLRPEVAEDAKGVMTLSASFSSLGSDAGRAFTTLQKEYPLLTGGYSAPKPVLLSRLLSWCNITGVFFPFTFEANVNTDVPDYSVPSTMCHELSHLRGFMREDEANFIGYLACCCSENPDLQYSGLMLAFIHANNALFAADAEKASEIYNTLNAGTLRDLAANNAYWKQFEGPAAEVAEAVNDTYLKVNRQEDGVRSYGRMVDLLLAEQRANNR